MGEQEEAKRLQDGDFANPCSLQGQPRRGSPTLAPPSLRKVTALRHHRPDHLDHAPPRSPARLAQEENPPCCSPPRRVLDIFCGNQRRVLRQPPATRDAHTRWYKCCD
ncbi:hypothetical protein E2C01_045350 [Portunus trituberculatus]|uniref:Uncharacterized protein n=1 Tax=Portunus trituberculatus TaxID=210409 RepID=A0A5B7G2M4_PORTR|nr:hypothetical protein [Portunus trituberculatus]